MKASRIIIMAVGIALFIFMIAPFASAQSVWLKGKISLKGFSINENLNEVTSKGAGALELYVNIVDSTDDFTVTTCAKNEATGADDDWKLAVRTLPRILRMETVTTQMAGSGISGAILLSHLHLAPKKKIS